MALVAAAVIVIAMGGFVLAQSGTPGEPRVSCIGVDPAECNRLWRDVLADTGEEGTYALGRNRVAKVTVTRQPGPCDTEMIEVVFYRWHGDHSESWAVLTVP